MLVLRKEIAKKPTNTNVSVENTENKYHILTLWYRILLKLLYAEVNMILTILLETGEYRKSKLFKSDYINHTYFLNTDTNEIVIHLSDSNSQYGLSCLIKELTNQWKFREWKVSDAIKRELFRYTFSYKWEHLANIDKKGAHFYIYGHRLCITQAGYQELQKHAAIGSELAIALQTSQLLIDLAEKNTDKLDKTLQQIINNKHHLITIDTIPSNQSDGTKTHHICYINPKITTELAKKIIKYFEAAIQRRFSPPMMQISVSDTTNKDLKLELISEEKTMPNPKIFAKIPSEIFDNLQKLYENNDEADMSLILTTNNIAQPSIPENSYAAINEKFSQIAVDDTLEGKIKVLHEYSLLISTQTEQLKHAYKKIGFKYIIKLFKSITNIEETAKLFDKLVEIQYLVDIHRNKIFDFIFFKNNTDSWQAMIGEIRYHSEYILSLQFNQRKQTADFEETKNFLNSFRNTKLFSEHRKNGLYRLGKTDTQKDIDSMLTHFERETNSNRNVFHN